MRTTNKRHGRLIDIPEVAGRQRQLVLPSIRPHRHLGDNPQPTTNTNKLPCSGI
jgi:hypothetical protein